MLDTTVRGAAVDCRRDQLWQKLVVSPSLSHLEFLELISLVHHQTLDKLDPRLAPLMENSPPGSTASARQDKYGEFSKQFSSEDGSVHHTVVLHKDNTALFALVSVDSVEGSLAIVHREEGAGAGASVAELLQGFVECCAFHAWSLLL